MTTRRHAHFNSKAKSWTSTEPASTEAIDRFHQSLPNYEPTPLVSLDSLAKEIGVGAVHVKDETNRFGLPAFKILGASWGAFRSITEKLGLPLDSDIETVREAAKSHQLTLYAATEGNHGRAVARMGAIFGISAEIHVPASMHPSTVNLIESEGAKVVISRGKYEGATLEAELASKHDKGIMVQDHAFGDYRMVPQWIVDGYGTMMREVDKQLGSTKADLVIAPVGVGSFAQAVVAHFKRKGTSTSMLAVEPDTAACLWKSLEKGEFTEIPTTGTIMAGLNCGAPSIIAWDLLRNGVDASLTVSDYEAHQSVLYLQSQSINAGPCGASTLAALRRLTPDDKEALGLDEKSTVVIFCTERNRDYDIPHDVSGNDPVALAQTLVQINSASPDLGSVPGPGERTIASYVTAWLEHRDLETHWVEYTKGRPSVVGVVRGSGEGKSVMFNGHLDTVTIMGYEDDPLSGKIVDGRLYGRGSADMKGGVAAAMIALANAKKLGLRGDVIFTGVADEESLSKGTEDILRAGWRADAAVVSEPTNLEINHAHKGYCHVEIKVYGLAAHGSRADLGIDAIVNAGHFLVEFGKYAKSLQEGRGDDTLGTGTAHASVISGGEEASSYPAQCTIVAERRTIPGETNEIIQKEFEGIIAKVAKEVSGFKAEAKIFFSRPPQFTAADHPFTKLVSEIVGKITGRDAVVSGAPFWTDCALLSEKGIVPLLWGPKGEGLHGKEEFVDVKSIEQVAEGLTNVAAEFCELYGALNRYKEDTNSASAWLASTAKSCGWKSRTVESNDNAQKKSSGRLKGKARKEAKKLATGKNNGNGQKYIVALDEFVPMAKCIAAYRKPRIKVPGSFQETLNRVIILRGTTTGFGLLEVHEPSQKFLDSPDVEKPRQMKEDRNTYEAELQESSEDALAMWHLLIEFDLAAAAVITDTGIQMVEDLVSQSLPLFDKHGGCLRIPKTYFSMKATQQGYSVQQAEECWSDRHPDTKLFEFFSRTFCHSLAIIEPLTTMFPKPLNISPNPTNPNPIERNLSSSEMLSKLKARRGIPGSDGTTLELSADQLMTTRFWNDALVFLTSYKQTGIIDKFSRYVIETSPTRCVPPDAERPVMGVLELEKDVKHLKAQIETYVASLSRPVILRGHPNLDESVRRVMHIFNITLGYCEAQRKQDKQGKGVEVRSEDSCTAFKLSPAFYGLVLHHTRARTVNMVMRIIIPAGGMTVMAHLYNAMQQFRMLKTPWTDMEKFTSEMEVIAPVSILYSNAVHRRKGSPNLKWDELAHIISASLCKETTVDDGTCALVSLDLKEKKQVKNRFTKPESKNHQQSAPLSPDQ
ncbi:diaminopropionate ammonia-lyase [Fusarium beomiforme]|uniref:Probable succinyl-diaminopimelate desuccinylase n=1 Tax=Fusarium beomiforme TaxID=44412 RepID=A0A9P5AI73_9HYPO|nr:diaminopropionate ammonia-lyase [Fusarium beomiforme]